MFTKLIIATTISLLLVEFACAQGTFLYDQQSSDESNLMEGGASISDSQSFTPSLSAVGFIRLYVYDGFPGFNSATIFVNLRKDSVNGAVLASTVTVDLGDGFVGPVDFFFSEPVAVTPGTTYYFDGQVQSGSGGFGLNASSSYGYSGGTAYLQGMVWPNTDVWFREGIVVPERWQIIAFVKSLGQRQKASP